ncbi:hypothetical protein [Lactiplantibacillus plantarum]|uniref:hypothetical protein n=1 Tax=Lactiplantibacillus plantarum TaxID=1590 RepID=UPI0012BB193A|nr:hypothetical protein [Lactiplantibacillus plantarum]UQK35671.1 hypothetical protein MKM38_14720 [Lactiplantibacillus plantarum]
MTTLVTVDLGAGIVGFAGLPAYSAVLSAFGVTVSLPSLLHVDACQKLGNLLSW